MQPFWRWSNKLLQIARLLVQFFFLALGAAADYLTIPPGIQEFLLTNESTARRERLMPS